MRKLVASIALATFALGAGSAMADGPNPVKYRQGIFQAVKWNFMPAVGMLKGEAEFDLETVKANGANLVALGKMMPGGFMAEGADKGENTTASSKIWSDMDGFKEAWTAYTEAAAMMAAVESKDDLAAAVGAMGKSCKGCHDNYREK